MITLDKNQIVRLHTKLLVATGGLNGIRDESMLDSALSAPLQTFDGVDLFPSTAAKIARFVYGIICNHPFVDGNKRTGMYAMLMLLELNHINTNFSDDDVIHIGLALANGKMSDKELLDFILEHSE